MQVLEASLKEAVKFDRSRTFAPLRRFCPTYRVSSLDSIDPDVLWDMSYRAILLDVDNTLIPWKGMKFPDTTIDWIAKCREAGLKLCIVSNTRNKPRLKLLSEKLGIPHAEGPMKPGRAAFVDAMRITGVPPEATIMVGDQLFTDVWGANRLGIASIWVTPMAKREFFGTKFSRLAERMITRLLKRHAE